MQPQSANTRHGLLARSAAIFAIRIAPALAAAAVGIAFAHRLPRGLNGHYAAIWVTLAIMLAVGGAGLQPFMLTHPADAIERWALALSKRVRSLLLGWILGCAAAFALLLYGEWELVHPLVLCLLFLAQLLTILCETYLIIHRRFVLVAGLSGGYALLFCAIHYLFLKGYFDFRMLLLAVSIIGSLRAAVLVFGTIKRYSERKGLLVPEPISDMVRSQWLQLGIYDASQILFRWIDKFFVGRIVGRDLFAIYTTGTTDVPFMHTLLGAAGSGLLQQLTVEPKTTDARVRLLRFSGSALSRIVFPVFFFLFCFRSEFIEVVFSRKYMDAVPLFAISSLAIPLRAYNFTSMLQHLNKVRMINLGALIDLGIALVLSYPLYLWKGLPGVAFAFTICSYGQALFYLYHTSRQLRCAMFRLIPWKAWAVQLILFGSAAIALRNVLAAHFGVRQTLFLGFAGTALVVVAALLPVVLNKKAHA